MCVDSKSLLRIVLAARNLELRGQTGVSGQASQIWLSTRPVDPYPYSNSAQTFDPRNPSLYPEHFSASKVWSKKHKLVPRTILCIENDSQWLIWLFSHDWRWRLTFFQLVSWGSSEIAWPAEGTLDIFFVDRSSSFSQFWGWIQTLKSQALSHRAGARCLRTRKFWLRSGLPGPSIRRLKTTLFFFQDQELWRLCNFCGAHKTSRKLYTNIEGTSALIRS